MPRFLWPALGLCLLFGASAASAQSPDWSRYKDAETVVIVTTDEDGAVRETTIWLCVLDGQGYVRTGSFSVWGENVQRTPEVKLRVDGAELALRAERVSDPTQIERLMAAFHEKYGFGDTLSGIVRGSPILFQLASS